MAYTDIFDQRNNDYGNKIRDSRSKSMKRKIISTFFDSPSYCSVQKLSSNSTTLTNLDSWIVDDSKTTELKTITLMPDQTIFSGDYIIWDNSHWLNLITDFQGDIYFRGSIKKCLSSLKWKDNQGAIKEAYFTLTKDTQTSIGIDEGKAMIIPKEMRYLTIQNNHDTIKIKKLQRFIFDDDRCWRTTSVNTLKTGIIELTLEETEISPELDDVVNRIASAYLHDYTIDITNGNSVNLITGGTLQLNVVTKDNGTVASLPVTYTSLTPSIATVSSSGFITTLLTGSVTVKASLTNDSSVFVTISIVVNAVVSPSNSISISNSTNFINVTQTKIISGTVMSNGVTDGTKTITWSLFAVNGVDPTTLAIITGQTGTNVTIKANSVSPYRYGNVVLKAVCIENTSIVATKVIQIKSLI